MARPSSLRKRNVALRKTDSSTLKQLRCRASSGHLGRQDSNSLEEVVKLQRWDPMTAPYLPREQIDVASDRRHVLNWRYLLVVACVGGSYAALVYFSLLAQTRRWDEQSHEDIYLSGPEGSALFPFVISFWYLFLAVVAVLIMENLKPIESLIPEAMVSYHIIQAALSAYIAVVGLQEAWALGLRLVGNPAPVRGVENYRLAVTAVLHYHLRILELLDTLFLICLKKIGRSSKVHVVMRLQNVWGWHIACRLGCGGDIYFPLVANAIGTTALHARYAASLLGQTWGRGLAMRIQVWVLYMYLVFGTVSFLVGMYPRTVLIVHILQVGIGIILVSNFHYEGDARRPPETSPEGKARLDQTSDPEDKDEKHVEAKLTFSFDSSGWCYLYHLGVGLWIQEQFADEIERGELAFSGSSGGGITAAFLAARVDIAALIDSNLQTSYPLARFKPWLVLGEMQRSLEKLFPKDAHVRVTNRCRLLLTRVLARPPFFMGEVAYAFDSREELLQTVMATSHIPFIFGFGSVLNGARYIDGLFWGSSFVPWRSFGKHQRVCRVSAFRVPGARISPRWTAIPPFWWPLIPPSRDALEGLMWAGYHDVAAAFGARDPRRIACGPCLRRHTSSGHMKDDARIQELIHIYECTAQKHWAIVIGILSLMTVVAVSVWLRFITSECR